MWGNTVSKKCTVPIISLIKRAQNEILEEEEADKIINTQIN